MFRCSILILKGDQNTLVLSRSSYSVLLLTKKSLSLQKFIFRVKCIAGHWNAIIMRKRILPIAFIISLTLGFSSFQTYAEPTLNQVKQMAAEGKSTAQYHLGMMYLSGEQGVPKDTNQALKWLTLADQNGSVGAKYSLGLMYMTGTGVSQDQSTAFKWFNKAAKFGHAKAQYTLGRMYNEGVGTEKNMTQAFEWIEKAALQSYPPAEFSLGLMYDNGRGVSQNKQQAIKWYTQAPEHQHSNAQYNLGMMYLNGEGTSKNLPLAKKWLQRAASAGDQDAKDVLKGLK